MCMEPMGTEGGSSMEYNRQEIMREAHRRRKADMERNLTHHPVFSEYLKMVWFEAKFAKWYYENHVSDNDRKGMDVHE